MGGGEGVGGVEGGGEEEVNGDGGEVHVHVQGEESLLWRGEVDWVVFGA